MRKRLKSLKLEVEKKHNHWDCAFKDSYRYRHFEMKGFTSSQCHHTQISTTYIRNNGALEDYEKAA